MPTPNKDKDIDDIFLDDDWNPSASNGTSVNQSFSFMAPASNAKDNPFLEQHQKQN